MSDAKHTDGQKQKNPPSNKIITINRVYWGIYLFVGGHEQRARTDFRSLFPKGIKIDF